MATQVAGGPDQDKIEANSKGIKLFVFVSPLLLKKTNKLGRCRLFSDFIQFTPWESEMFYGHPFYPPF